MPNIRKIAIRSSVPRVTEQDTFEPGAQYADLGDLQLIAFPLRLATAVSESRNDLRIDVIAFKGVGEYEALRKLEPTDSETAEGATFLSFETHAPSTSSREPLPLVAVVKAGLVIALTYRRA